MKSKGFADYERGFVEAFNHFLAHEIRVPYTSKHGIIVTTGNMIFNRLTNGSFMQSMNFMDINRIRLAKYNTDNVYISSYGHILYNHPNGQLTAISTDNISEVGRNITVIPNNVYYQLNLDKYYVRRYSNTVDLAMRCFLDFFERTNESMCSSDMLFEQYLYALAADDTEVTSDPFTAGYQVATGYINSF